MTQSKLYMGIDLGSVSLNIVVIDEGENIHAATYERTDGRPLVTLQTSLEALVGRFEGFDGIIVTGSGRKLLGHILKVRDVNEIVTQARAACHFYPKARTIMEIGGQDSKLIFLDRDARSGAPYVVDHVLNDICAAGTGSFLDLQAHRLGINIEDFGVLALCSNHPAKLSGRCSVFAKSDMVHLQQEGTPKTDIVAGLCFAMARNFITNLGKGRQFPRPILFQGGVAANPGVVKAFEGLLGLGPGDMIIPDHFLIMGALGSALMAKAEGAGETMAIRGLIQNVAEASKTARQRPRAAHLNPLIPAKGCCESADHYYGVRPGESMDVYLGVDVGAVSTNIVLIDRAGQLVAKQYWHTRGEAVETVRSGLAEMGRRVGPNVRVLGAGVTGSGRYFIGDFLGADVVINEISAQARGALHLDPEVDTVIEIGGQDSKYIRCENGRVVDFEMNKVCAAGTGSFLEEQGARLKIAIRKTFSDMAFKSGKPADLGARCTVFMESDLIHHQQAGYSVSDLAAGLAYAIANNYLEKVVGTKRIGRRIVFQGGVAGNQSVTSAFEQILGKPLKVSEHHNVTGALGAALAARAVKLVQSRFAGFNLQDRPYEVKTFECPKCPNLCRIHEIYTEGRLRSYYGSVCGRYEKVSDRALYSHLPDLFRERNMRLMEGFDEEDSGKGVSPVIGIPRTLTLYEHFPFWHTFFRTLGHAVVVSEKTNKSLVQAGLSHVPSETCYPVKTVYGHLCDLVSKGADRVLLPCEVSHEPGNDPGLRSFNCPYVQSMPYMARSALGSMVKFLVPILDRSRPRHDVDRAMTALGRSLGHGSAAIKAAVEAAHEAQYRYDHWRGLRGKDVLSSLKTGQRVLVLLGKCHNIFDEGLNLHLSRKLRRTGHLTIPYDMLPLDEASLPAHYENVVWKNVRDLMKCIALLRDSENLFPVLLTNFGCGPDSFFMKYMETELGDKPCLTLEVDEHTGDAGMVTRIEAFLDTLAEPVKQVRAVGGRPLNLVIKGEPRILDPSGPNPMLMRRLENRVIHFPYVSSGFSSAVQAAMEAVGLQARTLPRSDDESEYLGRQVTSSRECHPFIVTCGDLVKMIRQPAFDPDRTAVLMANYDGACRFSQYGIGYADLFRRLGLPQIPVIAPLTSPRFDEMSGLFGLGFTKLLWQGWMASEVMERLRLHVRPYEKKPGETDRVFESGIRDIAEAVARSNGRPAWRNHDVLLALKRGAGRLRAVPVDRSEKRPVIGILGEFYTVLDRWANHDIIRTLEKLGAEVRIHGLTITNCFSLFSEHYYAKSRLRDGKLNAALYYFLRNRWLMSWVRRTESCLPDDLRPFGNLDARTIMSEVAPFIHYDIDPILATFTTRVRRFAAEGISGICNLYVLNCMLGNITVPVFKEVLKGYKGLPVLSAIFDGQKETNMLTRIEAFMHQAKLYQERYRASRG